VVGCDNLKIFPYFGGKSRAIFGDNDSPCGFFNSRSSQRHLQTPNLLLSTAYRRYYLDTMMKLALLSAILASATAFAPAPAGRIATSVSETKADLQALAAKANPAIKFFDPLNLAEAEFWGTSNEATIGFLRESEVKHGRIAMFAFVGYIVHANGITWPWAMTLSGEPFPKVSSAPEAWDAIPEAAKWQIMLFIGFLEYVSSMQFVCIVIYSLL
jgi:hypothetical protein